MHLITGFLLTTLLKNKGKLRCELKRPKFLGGPVEITHAIPGRVRFFVPSLKNNSHSADIINERLTKLDSIYTITVTLQTGSVLLRYDSDKISEELLFAVIIRLLGLEQEHNRAPQPLITRELQNAGSSLNRAVFEKTNGIIDLWSTLMILLGGVGVYKLWSQPKNLFPGGITLIYWAVNALKKKNGK